jgi:hypothetical protein
LGDYRNLTMRRVMSKEDADKYVGEMVPDIEANVTEACVVRDADTGEPLFAYLPLPRGKVAELRRAVLRVKYGHTLRGVKGVINVSRVFGMSPRKPMVSRESCRPTTLSQEDPEAHAVIVNMAYTLADQMREVFPEVHERDSRVIQEVADDWRMAEGALWTSGVINKTSTLPYHRDGFNFDTWSAMPVVRRSVTGGYLHIPEYDIVCSARDGYSLYFYGHGLVHGVTPMTQTKRDGYRYSVVYYALRGMKDCFTYAMETARGQEKRTEREEGIASAIRGESDFIPGRNLKVK